MARWREGSRAEWEGIRRRGLARYLLARALLRGIPMAIALMLLLEVLQGRPIDRELLLDRAFEARLWIAAALFAAGGALSGYARWRSLDAIFGDSG
jgi:NhaP-type Na+/H+ or K+/H+ antiporter